MGEARDYDPGVHRHHLWRAHGGPKRAPQAGNGCHCAGVTALAWKYVLIVAVILIIVLILSALASAG